MNDRPSHTSFKLAEPTEAEDPWSKLIALARMIEIDKTSGTLTIINGKSRILMRQDGTIRIEGENIVHSALRNIALDAATIDLN
jgi:hypothetical protein